MRNIVSSVIAACVFSLVAATSTNATETAKKKPEAKAAEATKKDSKAKVAIAAKQDSKAKAAVVAKKDTKAKAAEAAKKKAKAKAAEAAKKQAKVKAAQAAKKKAKAKAAAKKKALLKTLALSGIASVYRYKKPRRSASGEIINFKSMVAAHRTLRFGTKVRVTNRKNGRSVIVRIIDRGPFIRGRVIDLSPAAARQIGLGWGLAPVSLAVVTGAKA